MVRPGLRPSSGLPQMLWSCLDLRMTARKDKVVAFSSRKETIKKTESSDASTQVERVPCQRLAQEKESGTY